MKFVGKKFGVTEGSWRVAIAVAVLCAALLSAGAVQAQTLEETMAEQRKQHIIPGKQLHVADARNYEFCEVAPILGTSMENAVANFYNPTGVDHCSPEQFAEIEKDKDKIIKEMGAMQVFL